MSPAFQIRLFLDLIKLLLIKNFSLCGNNRQMLWINGRGIKNANYVLPDLLVETATEQDGSVSNITVQPTVFQALTLAVRKASQSICS
ncbi:hypothetical protein C5167_006597 [Papaver somniferum]|uniref:Malectin-like domain-containing protein n=1 Tax=Papaver somniferum TaxID=3469 RepID=A0A4Y7JHQ8_PAPSO|nr:hypothetical protein C5167_006597 [Papaver somniferum]